MNVFSVSPGLLLVQGFSDGSVRDRIYQIIVNYPHIVRPTLYPIFTKTKGTG